MTTHRSVRGYALALVCVVMQAGCSGGSGSMTMEIDPATINLGESATITWKWKISGGGYCKARDAWEGTRDRIGSEAVTPTETGTYTYTLKCFQFNGVEEKKMSVTLTVNAAPASEASAAKAATLVAPRFAFVTNAFGPNVAVVDTATQEVTATIEFPAGSVPFAAAISPDLEKLYVTSLDAFSTCGANAGVFVIDTASHAITSGPIAVGCEPTGIAITPDGRHAYVASLLSDSISVIDTATEAVGAMVPLPDGGGVWNIAITPDGLRAYATAPGQSPVLAIDLGSNTVFGMPIDAGTNASGIAISPDGRLAYVANVNASGGVTVIDTATNTVIATTVLGDYPSAVAFTPDGTLAYVTQAGINVDGDFTVSMIDAASHAVVGSPIVVGSFPTSIAITADGTQAYVGNEGSGTVSVIDIATNAIATTLGGMNSPRSIAARPLPAPVRVPVPDVVGATEEAAASAIVGAGLVVGTVTEQASATIVRGLVISQNPAAGEPVAVGSEVNLVVSSGEAPGGGGRGGGSGGGGALDGFFLGIVAALAALASGQHRRDQVFAVP